MSTEIVTSIIAGICGIVAAVGAAVIHARKHKSERLRDAHSKITTQHDLLNSETSRNKKGKIEWTDYRKQALVGRWKGRMSLLPNMFVGNAGYVYQETREEENIGNKNDSDKKNHENNYLNSDRFLLRVDFSDENGIIQGVAEATLNIDGKKTDVQFNMQLRFEEGQYLSVAYKRVEDSSSAGVIQWGEIIARLSPRANELDGVIAAYAICEKKGSHVVGFVHLKKRK